MDSWVWIPRFGFLGSDSWVWSPGLGFLGLDSWVWSPGFGVLGLDPWVWIPGFGFLDLTENQNLKETLIKTYDLETGRGRVDWRRLEEIPLILHTRLFE